MFPLICYPCYLGQRLKSLSNSPLQFTKFINYPINKVINIPSISDNLFDNLKLLYQKNIDIQGPRINIGGDHSMAIATVAASLQQHPNLKVVWIDAHPDINTTNSSTTKNYHGMPLAFLSHLDSDSNLDFIKTSLKLENLIYLGIRDIDPYEKEILDKYEISNYSVSDCENELPRVLSDLESWIGYNPIHISFDVDSLDPSVLDSTGTPVPGGLSTHTAKHIIDLLYKHNWVNLDITELNVSLGNPDKSMKNLRYIMNNILEQQNESELIKSQL
jgi:arginase